MRKYREREKEGKERKTDKKGNSRNQRKREKKKMLRIENKGGQLEGLV